MPRPGFLEALQRHHVFSVAATHAGVGWLAIQVARSSSPCCSSLHVWRAPLYCWCWSDSRAPWCWRGSRTPVDERDAPATMRRGAPRIGFALGTRADRDARGCGLVVLGPHRTHLARLPTSKGRRPQYERVALVRMGRRAARSCRPSASGGLMPFCRPRCACARGSAASPPQHAWNSVISAPGDRIARCSPTTRPRDSEPAVQGEGATFHGRMLDGRTRQVAICHRFIGPARAARCGYACARGGKPHRMGLRWSLSSRT
jgi:hypothetical protein